MIIEQVRDKFVDFCQKRNSDTAQCIVVTPLSPDEAIGAKADREFAIKKGKERVIDAAFGDARGQAFTDRPAAFSGTLKEVLALEVSDPRYRAIFVAALNAVMRSHGAAGGTVHCRDEDPKRCGPQLARTLEERHGKTRVGLVGFQPAILAALVDRFGQDNVRVVDLNPDNIGETKSDVPIWDGRTDLPRLVKWSGIGLATGSSIVNGTIDEIHRRYTEAGKPVVYFGTTISGPAALLGLDRLCPFGA